MDSLDLPTLSDDELLDYEDSDDGDVIVNRVFPDAHPPNRTLSTEVSVPENAIGKPSENNTLKRKSTNFIELEEEEEEEDEAVHENEEIQGVKTRKSIVDRISLDSSLGDDNFARVKLIARRFGIVEPKENEVIKLNQSKLDALYESLQVDPNDPQLRFNTILVKGIIGVDKMSCYDVEKIFSEYGPMKINFIDESSCTIRWDDYQKTAKMLIEMSKPLQRVRNAKKAEEGELMESDDEEEIGQLKEENGEDVAVIDGADKNRKFKHASKNKDFVEIDIEKVKIPTGKWRVITKHVPDKYLLIVRFATGFEVRRGIINPVNRLREAELEQQKQQPRINSEGYEYAWQTKNRQVRPGLNVFDEKGIELDWDYEHDTRFFDKTISDDDNDEEKKTEGDSSVAKKSETTANQNVPQITERIVGDVKIRSRGRGTKKFFMLLDEDKQEGDGSLEEGTSKHSTNNKKQIENRTLTSDTCK